MHTQVTARPELGSMSDTELSEAWGAGDITVADLEAEVTRRDRAAKIRAASRERHSEWEAAAYANYQAAEVHCRGDANMLSEAGRRTGHAPWPMLWHGSREAADKLASDDLITWWDYTSPRPPSPAEYGTARREAAAEQQARNGYGSTDVSDTTAPARALPKVDPEILATWQRKTAEVRADHEAKYGRALMRRDDPAIVRATATSCNPADGLNALSLLSRFHQHYDYWEDPAYADLLAAWELQCAATEDDGSPIWRALPRLIVAGGYGNGKSGTLDQIAMATGSNVLVECTYPGIRDRIARDRKTVILDDAQMTFGTTGKRAEKVRLMINTHTKGRVTQDGKNGEQGAYGQIAMAGLSSLLAGKVAHQIADTLSRCFVLWKERKPKGVHVPEVTDAAEAQVRDKLVPAMREWCTSYRDTLKGRAAWFGEGNPTGLPDLGGGGRGNDQLARPLLTVCDVATALALEAWREAGKDAADFPAEHNWSERIRRALVFVAGVPEPVEDEESPLDGVSAAFDEMWATEAISDDED